MADDCGSCIVLLSIRPGYAKSIIDGTKRIEFRRKPFSQKVDNVVIYSTAPIKKIVALFTVSYITEGSPETIWARYRHASGIDARAFQTYFRGTSRATAIGIGLVSVVNPPVSLASISRSLYPPQSFAYLKKDLFRKLARVAGLNTLTSRSLTTTGIR